MFPCLTVDRGSGVMLGKPIELKNRMTNFTLRIWYKRAKCWTVKYINTVDLMWWIHAHLTWFHCRGMAWINCLVFSSLYWFFLSKIPYLEKMYSELHWYPDLFCKSNNSNTIIQWLYFAKIFTNTDLSQTVKKRPTLNRRHIWSPDTSHHFYSKLVLKSISLFLNCWY
jgi:hypothetical protein